MISIIDSEFLFYLFDIFYSISKSSFYEDSYRDSLHRQIAFEIRISECVHLIDSLNILEEIKYEVILLLRSSGY